MEPAPTPPVGSGPRRRAAGGRAPPALANRRAVRLGLRVLATTVGALALLWTGGLVWFTAQIPRQAANATTTTDAIIVPTGGAGRMEEGLGLLRAGLAKKLFITGVSREVSISQVYNDHQLRSEDVECCIEMGHTAQDTAGNAIEAARWMAKQGFRSLRLVTANYHMPRTLMEFRLAMPDVTLVANPIFPQHVKVDDWWRYRGTAGLIASEYAKYLLALSRAPFEQSGTQSTQP